MKQTLPPLNQYTVEIRRQIYLGRQTSPLADNTIIQVREQIILSSVYEQIPAIHQLEQEPQDLQVFHIANLTFNSPQITTQLISDSPVICDDRAFTEYVKRRRKMPQIYQSGFNFPPTI